MKFSCYAYQTVELFDGKYTCYFKPVTMHKIILHGKEIIENAALPVGSLSEEAQEAINKDCKQYRLSHSRKNSVLSLRTKICI